MVGDEYELNYLSLGVVVNEGTDPNFREGRIALQSEGAEIFYRNIKIAGVIIHN